jgi:hypothetical protein
MRTLNLLLRRFGLLVVPVPPSAKMLREHADVAATRHPVRGGRTVEWLYRVADLVGGS